MVGTPGTAPSPDAPTRRQGATAAVSSSRLKKREADRKAQRIAREKTKNRMAHLEGLVEELSRKDDNAATVSLMTRLSRATEQRNKLVSCLEATSSVFVKQLAQVKDLGYKGSSSESCFVSSSPSSSSDAKSALLNAGLLNSPGLDFLAPSLAPAVEPGEGGRLMSDTDTGMDVKRAEDDADCLVNVTTLDAGDLWIDGVFPSDVQELPPVLPITTPPPPSTCALASKQPEVPSETIRSQRKSTCSCAASTRRRRLSDGSSVSLNCWKAGNEILKEPFPLAGAMLDLESQG